MGGASPREDLLRRGAALDAQGRCAHWRGPSDVVLIRFPCCPGYWGCHECHGAEAGHPARAWPANRRDEAAVLCGACGATITIRGYLAASAADVPACPACAHPFNPRCALHHPLYFEGAG